jgi:hypothetical protein
MDQLLLNQILTLIAVEHDPGAGTRNIVVNTLAYLAIGQFVTAYVMGLPPLSDQRPASTAGPTASHLPRIALRERGLSGDRRLRSRHSLRRFPEALADYDWDFPISDH